MTLRAQCQCGGVRAEFEGELEAIVVCSCLACQRRTGSAFGEGAYVARDKVRLSGVATEYVRPTDAGNAFHQFFCPTCGTTLYFFSSRDPSRIGIAAGAFADPHLPKPSRSVFDESKHDWLVFSDDMPGFIRGRDSAMTRGKA